MHRKPADTRVTSSRPSGKARPSNRLLALSSAAVLAVYAAGYKQTQSAAARFEEPTPLRRAAPTVEPPASVSQPPVLEPERRPRETSAAPPAEPAAPSAAKPTPAPKPATPRASTPTPTVATAAPAPDVKSAPAPASDPAPAPPAAAAPAPAVETAPPVAAPAAAPPAATAPRWKDGTYTGWGTSRHGDIQAQVVIENGRIASATIAQCLTRYSCSWIAALPPQVVQRQSPETDYVSGATQSTNAFYYGVVEALSKAK